MKVILLNAGIGKRLAPITNKIPKCLVRIKDDVTILDNQIKNLLKFNLESFIILTGPFEEQIRNHMKKYYPSTQVQYINNPMYDKTNYIYSIHLAKKLINENVLITHGDLIFSEKLIAKLIESDDENCVLVNKEIPPPVKDFKAMILNDRIYNIGVNLIDPQAAFLAPFYKLSKKFIFNWLKQIEIFVNHNKVRQYAEDALNEILDKEILKACYFNEFCAEVDDHDDLQLVRKYFENKH